MVTALKPENETISTVAENAAPSQQVADVDVSAVPETPAELLKQWEVARRPSIQNIVTAPFVRVWNYFTGPAMTERDRLTREIAEAKGNANGFIKLA